MGKLTMQELDSANNKIEAPIEVHKEETNVAVESNIEIKNEEAPEITLDGVVKEKFKSVDEFNTFWGEYQSMKTNLDSLGQTKTELETKAKTYEQKLKEYEEAGFIDDETYYKLAKLKKSNPEKAKLVEKVLFGNPSPTDLIKLKLKEENPLYADKEELIDSLLEEDYGIGIQLPDEDDEDYHSVLKKKNVKEMKLSAEAEGYKKKILSELDPIEIRKPKTDADKKAEEDNYIAGWNKPFNDIKEQLSEIKITNKSEDGSIEELFSYKLSEADKEKYLKPIANIIANGRYETNPETINGLVDMAKKEYLADNMSKIILEAIGKAKKDGFEYYRNKMVSTPTKNNEAKPQAKETDPKVILFNKAMGRG